MFPRTPFIRLVIYAQNQAKDLSVFFHADYILKEVKFYMLVVWEEKKAHYTYSAKSNNIWFAIKYIVWKFLYYWFQTLRLVTIQLIFTTL